MLEIIKEYPTLSAAIGVAGAAIIGTGRQVISATISRLGSLFTYSVTFTENFSHYYSVRNFIIENMRGLRKFGAEYVVRENDPTP
jgi:hypothetical protein